MLSGHQWHLTVLARATAYPNLTAASAAVGLSQPQLSRLVGELEAVLGLQLLDRKVRKASSWTAAATRLAELTRDWHRRLDSAVGELKGLDWPDELRAATLEGLATITVDRLARAWKKLPIGRLVLDVFDLDELERRFATGECDIIFTMREPSRRKTDLVHVLGHQRLDFIGTSEAIRVHSQAEYARRLVERRRSRPDRGRSSPGAKLARELISNSLAVRRHWLEKHEGQGWIPSQLSQSRPRDGFDVVVIAKANIDSRLWTELTVSK